MFLITETILEFFCAKFFSLQRYKKLKTYRLASPYLRIAKRCESSLIKINRSMVNDHNDEPP